jgi:hypothetical protein
MGFTRNPRMELNGESEHVKGSLSHVGDTAVKRLAKLRRSVC